MASQTAPYDSCYIVAIIPWRTFRVLVGAHRTFSCYGEVMGRTCLH